MCGTVGIAAVVSFLHVGLKQVFEMLTMRESMYSAGVGLGSGVGRTSTHQRTLAYRSQNCSEALLGKMGV